MGLEYVGISRATDLSKVILLSTYEPKHFEKFAASQAEVAAEYERLRRTLGAVDDAVVTARGSLSTPRSDESRPRRRERAGATTKPTKRNKRQRRAAASPAPGDADAMQ